MGGFFYDHQLGPSIKINHFFIHIHLVDKHSLGCIWYFFKKK